MKVTYPTIGFLVFLLSGCTFTPYNTHFECPLENGVPCTRLSKINRMVDRGELGTEENEHDDSVVPQGSSCKGSCSVKSLSRDIPITYFYKKETPVLEEHPQVDSALPVEEIEDIQPLEIIKVEETTDKSTTDEPSIVTTEEAAEL